MESEWMIWLREHMPKSMLEEFESERRHDLSWRDKEIARLTEGRLKEREKKSKNAKEWYLICKKSKRICEGPIMREQAEQALKGYSSDVQMILIDVVVLDRSV